jgi:SAM-dependent methyltransferase
VAAGSPSLSIHPQAARGFGRAAEEYERGRPGYPAAATAWLGQQLGLCTGRTALDVGAGTGKLTRALLPTGAKVIAVEPLDQMRAVLEREAPEAQALPGRAEAIPLADASVDAIAVGQAFHWFDGPGALAEFHRVLRADGRLGLIWNRRDSTQPLHRAIDEIIDRYRLDVPAYNSDVWSKVFAHNPLFAELDRAQFTFDQELDGQGLVDRITSISYVSALEDGPRRRVEEQLRALAEDGLEPLRHITQVFVYGRVGQGVGSAG